MSLNKLIKQRQSDIDKLAPAVLFESSPEPEEQEKPTTEKAFASDEDKRIRRNDGI